MGLVCVTEYENEIRAGWIVEFRCVVDAQMLGDRGRHVAYFNEVFELQQHKDLKDSFDFLAESLNAARADFYVVPGKGHELAVTVATKKKKKGYLVEAIYIDGVDVLRSEEDAWDSDDEEIFYTKISQERLGEKLSVELVVPERLLTIAYTPLEAKNGELHVPMGWKVGK